MRVDVLAAADQHVLGAVGEEDEAFLVHVADIAGDDPAIDIGLGGGFRLVPVELAVVGALDPQLAHLVGAERLAVGADDLEIHRDGGRAAGIRAALVVLAEVHARGGAGFRHAPAVRRDGFGEALLDGGDQRGRGWRAAIADDGDGGEIVLVAIGMLQHLPGDGGHAADGGDLLALDDLERVARIPLVHRDDLVGVHDRGDEVRERAGGVEERDGQQRDALADRPSDRARAGLRPGAGSGAPGRTCR